MAGGNGTPGPVGGRHGELGREGSLGRSDERSTSDVAGLEMDGSSVLPRCSLPFVLGIHSGGKSAA